jgi:hypothetical protein
VTEKTKWGLGGLTVGIVGTALILTAVVRDDEDRPPMVVKGGSLIFQSGVDAAHPGKRWKKNANSTTEWQMDHPRGKPTRTFLVMMSGSGSCGPAFVPELSLEYTLSSGGTARFQVVRRPQNGSGNKQVPTVIGDGLTENNSGDTPTVTFGSAGELTRVTANGIDCRSPGAFAIHSAK